MSGVKYYWQLNEVRWDEVLGVEDFMSYSKAREHQAYGWPIYLVRRTSTGKILRAPVSWTVPLATDLYPSLPRMFIGSAIKVPDKYRQEIIKEHMRRTNYDGA